MPVLEIVKDKADEGYDLVDGVSPEYWDILFQGPGKVRGYMAYPCADLIWRCMFYLYSQLGADGNKEDRWEYSSWLFIYI